jgi:hypothetical protein
MRISNLYRGLLSLYPADFRKQFSEEMFCVFEQRAGERFARSAPVGFVLAELSSIVREAYPMWLAKILPVHRHRSDVVAATDASPTLAELMKHRETAIKNMVASIATHDFINARRYSYEAHRLNNLLQNLQNGKSVEHSEIIC